MCGALLLTAKTLNVNILGRFRAAAFHSSNVATTKLGMGGRDCKSKEKVVVENFAPGRDD